MVISNESKERYSELDNIISIAKKCSNKLKNEYNIPNRIYIHDDKRVYIYILKKSLFSIKKNFIIKFRFSDIYGGYTSNNNINYYINCSRNYYTAIRDIFEKDKKTWDVTIEKGYLLNPLSYEKCYY